MTIIIALPKIGIWTDSRCSDGVQNSHVVKGFVHDGMAYGFAGVMSSGLALMKWVIDDACIPHMFPDDYVTTDTLMIRVRGDFAGVEIFEKSPFAMPLFTEGRRKYHCIGSGAAYAQGALSAGATPMEALAIAGDFDAACGGRSMFYPVGIK
jgi:hypothetical protein